MAAWGQAHRDVYVSFSLLSHPHSEQRVMLQSRTDPVGAGITASAINCHYADGELDLLPADERP